MWATERVLKKALPDLAGLQLSGDKDALVITETLTSSSLGRARSRFCRTLRLIRSGCFASIASRATSREGSWLPNGQVVETRGRRTPLYDLARKLDELGFGDWKLQAYTPTGTPSLRGNVSVMAARPAL